MHFLLVILVVLIIFPLVFAKGWILIYLVSIFHFLFSFFPLSYSLHKELLSLNTSVFLMGLDKKRVINVCGGKNAGCGRISHRT